MKKELESLFSLLTLNLWIENNGSSTTNVQYVFSSHVSVWGVEERCWLICSAFPFVPGVQLQCNLMKIWSEIKSEWIIWVFHFVCHEIHCLISRLFQTRAGHQVFYGNIEKNENIKSAEYFLFYTASLKALNESTYSWKQENNTIRLIGFISTRTFYRIFRAVDFIEWVNNTYCSLNMNENESLIHCRHGIQEWFLSLIIICSCTFTQFLQTFSSSSLQLETRIEKLVKWKKQELVS